MRSTNVQVQKALAERNQPESKVSEASPSILYRTREVTGKIANAIASPFCAVGRLVKNNRDAAVAVLSWTYVGAYVGLDLYLRLCWRPAPHLIAQFDRLGIVSADSMYHFLATEDESVGAVLAGPVYSGAKCGFFVGLSLTSAVIVANKIKETFSPGRP